MEYMYKQNSLQLKLMFCVQHLTNPISTSQTNPHYKAGWSALLPQIIVANSICWQIYQQILYSYASNKLKLFKRCESAGSEITLRCIKCRDCSRCHCSSRNEFVSLQEEVEEDVINKSVTIDLSLQSCTAHLPLMYDPIVFKSFDEKGGYETSCDCFLSWTDWLTGEKRTDTDELTDRRFLSPECSHKGRCGDREKCMENRIFEQIGEWLSWHLNDKVLVYEYRWSAFD